MRSADSERKLGASRRPRSSRTRADLEEQFDRIVEIRDKKVRKLLRSQEEGRRNDREFGELAVHLERVDLDALESAVLEQQKLRQLNLHFGLAEVLVARKVLSARDVQRIYAILGRSMLRCCYCDLQFQVAELHEGAVYPCPRCRATLEQPVYLDPLLVAGVVELEERDESVAVDHCVEEQ